jgi:hypothetical protein
MELPGVSIMKQASSPDLVLFIFLPTFCSNCKQMGSIQSHIAVSIIEDLAWEDNMLKRRSNFFGTQS